MQFEISGIPTKLQSRACSLADGAAETTARSRAMIA